MLDDGYAVIDDVLDRIVDEQEAKLAAELAGEDVNRAEYRAA